MIFVLKLNFQFFKYFKSNQIMHLILAQISQDIICSLQFFWFSGESPSVYLHYCSNDRLTYQRKSSSHRTNNRTDIQYSSREKAKHEPSIENNAILNLRSKILRFVASTRCIAALTEACIEHYALR